MPTDVMIDMETLGTKLDSVILTIGACRFDPYGDGITDQLSLRLTVDDQTEIYNRTIDEGTIRWWANQNPEAIEEALGDENRTSFKDAMQQLYKFCWNRRAVWSNGAAFDIVLAETAFRQLDMRIPWFFYNVRDTRTLYEISQVRLSDDGNATSHKAVEDAIKQAKLVQKAFRKITVNEI